MPESGVRYHTPEEVKNSHPIEEFSEFDEDMQEVFSSQNISLLKSNQKKWFKNRKETKQVNQKAYYDYPNVTVGKLVVDVNSKEKGNCSASTVTSPGENLVITAAHCISDGYGRFYENINFIPAYGAEVPTEDDNEEGILQYGTSAEPWKVCKWRVLNGFHNYKTKPYSTELEKIKIKIKASQYDVAVLKVCPDLTSRGMRGNVHESVGSLGIRYSTDKNQNWTILGYPEKPEPRFNGEKMIACLNSSPPLITNYENLIGISNCEMKEGASGGPWIANYSFNSWGGNYNIINGISVAYPKNGGNVVYSPYFGRQVEILYNEAVKSGF
ncbi:hypothetical protein C7B80_32350 [Cyanosarcina cf. burmensis CCALA 770]|nr:hypothetical protein C7B80_32350 [Cyanosarcina cf. burmensis CCALA 770]